MTRVQRANRGLPNPDYRSEMYRDVAAKRLLAWVIDVVLIVIMVAVLSIFSLGIAFLIMPILYGTVSFLYRWSTLSAGSATLGMRFMAIEVRRADGDTLDGTTAFWHTFGYFISFIITPLQVISVAMMAGTPRNQGLTDMVLGTVVMNKQMS